jgi:putative membrane protein
MIKNFADHAANERTFLAWVRTAIAVMAFGFLIVRFDLIMRMTAKAVADDTIPLHRAANDITGLIFIFMGIGIIAVAAARFRRMGKEIDNRAIENVYSERVDLAFAGLLFLLSIAMCLTVYHAITTLF